MNVCASRLALACFSVPLLAMYATGCGGPDTEPGITSDEQPLSPSTSSFPATFARQWMTNVANSVKNDTISPPVAARIYAYTAIGLYESVVHGMPGYQSLAGQLNGLASLPTPDPGLDYDWPSVMAETMSVMMAGGVYVFPNRVFFEHTTLSQAPLFALGKIQLGFRKTQGVSQQVIDNSVAFGDALGNALVQWSMADGYYDLRYKGWIPPKGPSKWVATGFSDTDKASNPLEPWFGSVRPLVMETGDECSPANLGLAPPPFSDTAGSDFYNEALAVYNTEVNLTDQQREIANFWADGPGATATPAGHWVAITTKFVRNTDLAIAAKSYAYLSIGFLDSFIAIWQEKFNSNLLRPVTYIRRNIDPGWQPFLPTPQFPTYVSGHSGQSGASAVLLTQLFGGGPFVDDTKLRRGFAARSFPNFTAAANEAAVSRFYGGIHYNFDDNDGLVVGQCVGDAIVARVHLTP